MELRNDVMPAPLREASPRALKAGAVRRTHGGRAPSSTQWVWVQLLALCALVCSGCSISLDDGPAEALSLAHLTITPPSSESLIAFEEAARSKSGAIYRVTREAPESSSKPSRTHVASVPAFATALKSCTVAEGESILTVARRLFVGLRAIRIMLREEKMPENASRLAAPVMLLGLQATLDNSPLTIFTVSTIVDDCSVDIALWEPSHSPDPALEALARDIQEAGVAAGGELLWELARQ